MKLDKDGTDKREPNEKKKDEEKENRLKLQEKAGKH